MNTDGRAWQGWLAFTLYISAARYEANAVQLATLRSHVLPAIEGLKRRDLSVEETRRLLAIILTRIQTIMGPHWRPRGEFMVYIDKLVGGQHVRSDDQSARLDRQATRRRARARRARHALASDVHRRSGQSDAPDGR